MMLTKQDRNKIHEVIAESNLDPAECNLEVTDNEVVLTHNSGSRFDFKPIASSEVDELYSVTYVVADGGTRKYNFFGDLDGMLIQILKWANEVKETLELPDLWAEMRRGRDLIANIQRADSANIPFTQDERRRIAGQLHEITKQLKEQFVLTNEQTERIDEWRDEVIEASTRMGRKDWLIYLLGTITALTIAATVPAGIGEHIFAMVIHGLVHLFTGGSEPPQTPPQILA